MRNYRQGDLVKVPFPYTDRNTRQRRPAFVLSNGPVKGRRDLLWVVMVTSAENRGWPGDIAIPDHPSSGLPAPSLIGVAKLATIELADAEPLGRVSPEVTADVLTKVADHLGLQPPAPFGAS